MQIRGSGNISRTPFSSFFKPIIPTCLLLANISPQFGLAGNHAAIQCLGKDFPLQLSQVQRPVKRHWIAIFLKHLHLTTIFVVNLFEYARNQSDIRYGTRTL